MVDAEFPVDVEPVFPEPDAVSLGVVEDVGESVAAEGPLDDVVAAAVSVDLEAKEPDSADDDAFAAAPDVESMGVDEPDPVEADEVEELDEALDPVLVDPVLVNDVSSEAASDDDEPPAAVSDVDAASEEDD